ncbi:MAG: glutathione S-transferase domain-containing protein [Osedax symbiont Rs2]|nr:MAG: glutathione S-transferase domain-containing protein [Osedax symbiont Rs2]
MKFYYTPGTISLAVHIALEMSAADYQAIAIDFSTQEQRSDEFLALNPLGRVPALVTEDGVLTEAPAILNYLAAEYPQAQFATAQDNFLKAKIDSFNSYMCSTVHVAHAHLWRGGGWGDSSSAKDAMAQKVPENMTDCFNLIENSWLQGPWVQGEKFSSSDLYLFVVSRWLSGDSVDLLQFENVNAHQQKMLQLPEVQALLKGLYA